MSRVLHTQTGYSEILKHLLQVGMSRRFGHWSSGSTWNMFHARIGLSSINKSTIVNTRTRCPWDTREHEAKGKVPPPDELLSNPLQAQAWATAHGSQLSPLSTGPVSAELQSLSRSTDTFRAFGCRGETGRGIDQSTPPGARGLGCHRIETPSSCLVCFGSR